jgi:16S rRNA (cytidine1402-2'-O)-methyltransferase
LDSSPTTCKTPLGFGRLYVVATPIGNLKDISKRMIETLTTVDLIACEDTRHTRNLCRHLHIATPLTSYYREKEQQKSEQLLVRLLAGEHIALVSDAGTPGLSDPGAILISKARQAGIEILAIPGPSALTAALSVAGLPQTGFFFAGFPPASKSERRQLLRTLVALPYPLVFFESPHRISASLADMERVLGDRRAQLFRELTKIYEECLEGSLSALTERVDGGIKGELVLIVEGAAGRPADRPEEIDDLLRWYRDELRASVKDAVRAVADDLDLSRSQVYKKALAVWQELR